MGRNEKNHFAELYELEPDQPIDISDRAFEDVRASLEKVEAMKVTVTECIVRAKEKDLRDHAERFRAILRKLVTVEKALRESQDKKTTAKVAFELDQLEQDCNVEIDECETVANGGPIDTKNEILASRFRIASTLVGVCGVLACLLGCIIYLIFTQETVLNLPFEWVWLVINGVGAIAFVLAGYLLYKRSLYYVGLVEQEEYERMKEEEAQADYLAWEVANIEALAYSMEMDREREMKAAAEKKPSDDAEKAKKGLFAFLKKKKKEDADKEHSKVVVAAFVAGVVTTAVTLIALASSKKSEKPAKEKNPKKEKKKAPKVYGVFFQMQDE